VSDNDLGLFLRTRREAVTPAEAGLPTGARRRTPGLRRSELAMLAGVSVEYVTRLEQGRDRRPSTQVLGALAEALRLTLSERVHLYRLTKTADGAFACVAPGAFTPNRTARPAVRALLDRLDPTPAVLRNRQGESLAWTPAYERVAGPVGLLDGDPPSLARFVFGDDRAPAAYPDWNHVADETVATLKHGPYRMDPGVMAVVDELTVTAGRAFTHRLETVPGLPSANGRTRLTHPEAGELRLAYETLELSADDEQHIVAYLPADDATAAALDHLTGREPRALRAVPG
jgi:transcriptional regulator with XRE-family HTH domain